MCLLVGHEYSENEYVHVVLVGLLLYLNNNVKLHERTLPALCTHLCWDILHKPAAQSNILWRFCIVVEPGRHITHIKLFKWPTAAKNTEKQGGEHSAHEMNGL